ncbi:hypothetical protein LTR17_024859 [Elasticomyces elasticus]|nr:hypothetical protein LTR17_024859 [Elasticomyces elasticus]
MDVLKATSEPYIDKHTKKLTAIAKRFAEERPTHAQAPSRPTAPFSYPLYPLKSKAQLPTCPETCAKCAEQYLPRGHLLYPERRRCADFFSDEHAQTTTQQFVRDTKANLAAVKERLDKYGDAFLKRWERRSVSARAALVRQALPQAHDRNFAPARVEFEYRRSYYSSLGDSTKCKSKQDVVNADVKDVMVEYHLDMREAHLLHYLDLQTLSEDPMALISLLYHRSHTEPADWVLFDKEMTRIPFDVWLWRNQYNPHAVIMYGQHYGRLINWNKHSAHALDIIGFPRAVLILEAQDRLAKFMRTMIDLVLAQDLQAASVGSVLLDNLAQLDFQRGAHTRRLDAFRPPPCYDIQIIVDLLGGVYESLLDGLFALQADPIHFRDYIASVKGTAFLDSLDNEQREERTLVLTLGYFVWTDVFRVALEQADYVRRKQEQYGNEVRAGKSMPEDYACALVLLGRHLENVFSGQLVDLANLQAATGTFEGLEIFRGDGVGRLRLGGEDLFRADPILWNMNELQDLDASSQRPTFYLAFIDQLMTEHGNTKVDALLATHFSSMAVVQDILASIKYHRPQPDIGESSEALAVLAVDQPANKEAIAPCGFSCNWPGKSILWPLLQTVMDLPLPSARVSRLALARRRDLRCATEEFWDSVARAMYHEFLGRGLEEDDTDTSAIVLFYRLTPQYQKEVADEYRRLEEELDLKEQEEAHLNRNCKPAIQPLQNKWGHDNNGSVPDQVERKQKTKTRRTDDTQPATQTIEQQFSTIDMQQTGPKLAVKPESKLVFDRMFSTSTELADVSWDSFVAAMIDAGCSITPNGGSAFTFKDLRGSKASIVYHRPHPDPTINPIMLRSMRYRLRKWFEWDVDTFVEREKGRGKESGGKEDGGKEAGEGEV